MLKTQLSLKWIFKSVFLSNAPLNSLKCIQAAAAEVCNHSINILSVIDLILPTSKIHNVRMFQNFFWEAVCFPNSAARVVMVNVSLHSCVFDWRHHGVCISPTHSSPLNFFLSLLQLLLPFQLEGEFFLRLPVGWLGEQSPASSSSSLPLCFRVREEEEGEWKWRGRQSDVLQQMALATTAQQLLQRGTLLDWEVEERRWTDRTGCWEVYAFGETLSSSLSSADEK